VGVKMLLSLENIQWYILYEKVVVDTQIRVSFCSNGFASAFGLHLAQDVCLFYVHFLNSIWHCINC